MISAALTTLKIALAALLLLLMMPPSPSFAQSNERHRRLAARDNSSEVPGSTVLAHEEAAPRAAQRTDVYVPWMELGRPDDRNPIVPVLSIHNPDSSAASVQVFRFWFDRSNPHPAVYNDTISPGETRRYERVSEVLFGETGPSVLHIVSDRILVVRLDSATRSLGKPDTRELKRSGSDPEPVPAAVEPVRPSMAGARAEDLTLRAPIGYPARPFIAPVPASFAMREGERTRLLGFEQPDELANLASYSGTGLVEIAGEKALVRITVSDVSGRALLTREDELGAFEPKWYRADELNAGGSFEPVSVQVEFVAGAGSVVAFGAELRDMSRSTGKSGAIHEADSPDTDQAESAPRAGLPANEKTPSANEKAAQQGTLSGSGLSGQIAMWTGGTSLGNSNISQNGPNGNISIGPNPSQVEGSRLNVDGSGRDAAIFATNYEGDAAIVGNSRAGKGISASSETNAGVEGLSVSDAGVLGKSDSGRGVHGVSKTFTGVLGESEKWNGVGGISKGDGFGVIGRAEGTALAGVHGRGLGAADGVQGEVEGSGVGVKGMATSGDGVRGESESGRGVHGSSKSLTGVLGESEGGPGVAGVSKGGTFGVLGRAENGATAGVHGQGTGSAIGVQGEAEGGGIGVKGKSSSAVGVMGESSGGSAGVEGKGKPGVRGESTDGVGVEGKGSPGVRGESTGGGVGVEGKGNPGLRGESTDGVGVEGKGNPGLKGEGTGGGVGVLGESTDGRGVEGRSTTRGGVVGISDGGSGVGGISTSNIGVSGQSKGLSGVEGTGQEGSADGVRGFALGSGRGIYGDSRGSGSGVHGKSSSGIGVEAISTSNTGVEGTSTSGVGVEGRSQSNSGVEGESESGVGVFGSSRSNNGVEGRSENRSGISGVSPNYLGVRGESTSSYGVQGSSETSLGVLGSSKSGKGVQGQSESGAAVVGISVSGTGVEGQSQSQRGVVGMSVERSGMSGFSTRAVGMYGESMNNAGGWFVTGTRDSYGIVGGCFNGVTNCRAALLNGSSQTVGVKFFHIDHPLYPASKFLNHASVESSEIKNLYDGFAVLDGNGEAVVTLPEWFEALNGEFRYQLTAVGAAGPNLYVAEEIANNRFRIAGGMPGMKVSWLVTGNRQDAFVKANPIQVEENKTGAEQGRYLTPELFGQPKEKGILGLYNPDFAQSMEEKRSPGAGHGESASRKHEVELKR
ncbi:MAG: hypothetical protein HY650_04295 [Acidobacteria bacterium]|nr:hypothetical protein [Acidobacteriota bacterium]